MQCCSIDVVLTWAIRLFRYTLLVATAAFLVMPATLCCPWDGSARASHPQAVRQTEKLGKKVEAYKRFKAHYEDKDFHIKSWPFNRTSYHRGRVEKVSHTLYTLSYGTVVDKLKNYNKNVRRIVHSPTDAQVVNNLACEDGLYFEHYDPTGMHPDTSCLKETGNLSYAMKLIFATLTEAEQGAIVLVNEFPEGDLDIQFTADKAADLDFVTTIWQKLAAADEMNDQRRPPTRMEPIIPDEYQLVSISYIDLQKDGEPEFVLLSYCIDGSYFDEDPSNNTVQVGLKYKLITMSDLANKEASQRAALEKRLGLWMWDKPVEILISFADHPGPDIVFDDRGVVIDGSVIDPAPDGEFDHFEFLF